MAVARGNEGGLWMLPHLSRFREALQQAQREVGRGGLPAEHLFYT